MGGSPGLTAKKTGMREASTFGASPKAEIKEAQAIAKSSPEPLSEEEKYSKAMSGEGWKQAAVTGGAGLLEGLAAALLADDVIPDRGGRAALPAGSPGSIKGTAGTQMSFNNPRLGDRQTYALEMLRGGYK